MPNIIVEIARVQNAGKLEKECCDENAMQLFPLHTGRKLDFRIEAEYSFARLTAPACTEISPESPWDVQSWEQLNTPKKSNHYFSSASAVKDITPGHVFVGWKSTHQ